VPDLKNTTFMVSGPPVMVEGMKKNLTALGVTKKQIRTDLFISYEV